MRMAIHRFLCIEGFMAKFTFVSRKFVLCRRFVFEVLSMFYRWNYYVTEYYTTSDSSRPPHASSLPPHTSSLPPHTSSLPPHASSKPPHASSTPPHASSKPPHLLTFASSRQKCHLRESVTHTSVSIMCHQLYQVGVLQASLTLGFFMRKSLDDSYVD